MTQKTRNFTVADPRTFDGDPFEVAERASRQALALTDLLSESVEGANTMARNAEMERQLQRGEDPDAPGWGATPQGKHYAEALRDVTNLKTRLSALAKAAGFNPRKPQRV